MIVRILEIAILVLVMGSGIYGVYYSIKLRIQSKKLLTKERQTIKKMDDDKDIVRIFEELEKKAAENNSDFIAAMKSYKENESALEIYQDFLYNDTSETVVLTSNHAN